MLSSFGRTRVIRMKNGLRVMYVKGCNVLDQCFYSLEYLKVKCRIIVKIGVKKSCGGAC